MTALGTVRLAAICCVFWSNGGSTFAQDCPDQTQTGLNQCAAQSHAKADAALNLVYKQIVQKLGGRDIAAGLFVKAQKSWLAFRDSQCAFVSSGVSGGSIHPMIYSLCLEQVTEERVKQLQNYLKCAEGDLSCPVPPG